jgi:hypothetical protein
VLASRPRCERRSPRPGRIRKEVGEVAVPFPSTARLFLKTKVRRNCRPANSFRPSFFLASRPVPLLHVAWPGRVGRTQQKGFSCRSLPRTRLPHGGAITFSLLTFRRAAAMCDGIGAANRRSSFWSSARRASRAPHTHATPCDVAAGQVDRAIRRSDDSSYGQQRGASGTPAPTIAALCRTRTSAAFVSNVRSILQLSDLPTTTFSSSGPRPRPGFPVASAGTLPPCRADLRFRSLAGEHRSTDDRATTKGRSILRASFEVTRTHSYRS